MEEFNSISEILDFAINAEQEAVDFYTSLAATILNPEMKSTFEQFAREEMGHKAHLTRIRETGIFRVHTQLVPDLRIADYLVAVSPSPGMSYQDALILAMQKEKAAFRLYSKLASKAPNEELRQVFQILAMEESKHKLRFEIEFDEFVLREN